MSDCRSQWPRGLSCRSAAARLLRSWVRIPAAAWVFVCCECCVLSGRGLCDKLITCPEESYRLWCVVECDLQTSRMRKPWPALGRSATKKKSQTIRLLVYFNVSTLKQRKDFPLIWGFTLKVVGINEFWFLIVTTKHYFTWNTHHNSIIKKYINRLRKDKHT
jgi:hypothetical protein